MRTKEREVLHLRCRTCVNFHASVPTLASVDLCGFVLMSHANPSEHQSNPTNTLTSIYLPVSIYLLSIDVSIY